MNLREAVQLYEALKPHLPSEELDTLNYVHQTIQSINASGQHWDYVKAVHIMTGYSLEDMKRVDPEDVLQLFAEGLGRNKIVSLVEFCKRVNYGNS